MSSENITLISVLTQAITIFVFQFIGIRFDDGLTTNLVSIWEKEIRKPSEGKL